MTKVAVMAKVGNRTVHEILRDFNRQEIYDMAQAFDVNVVHLKEKSTKVMAAYLYDKCHKSRR